MCGNREDATQGDIKLQYARPAILSNQRQCDERGMKAAPNQIIDSCLETVQLVFLVAIGPTGNVYAHAVIDCLEQKNGERNYI